MARDVSSFNEYLFSYSVVHIYQIYFNRNILCNWRKHIYWIFFNKTHQFVQKYVLPFNGQIISCQLSSKKLGVNFAQLYNIEKMGAFHGAACWIARFTSSKQKLETNNLLYAKLNVKKCKYKL